MPNTEKLTKTRKPKAANGEAWGILNPWGDVWTHEAFRTAEEATVYLKTFWRNIPEEDTSRFSVVRVRVRVSALSKEDK